MNLRHQFGTTLATGLLVTTGMIGGSLALASPASATSVSHRLTCVNYEVNGVPNGTSTIRTNTGGVIPDKIDSSGSVGGTLLGLPAFYSATMKVVNAKGDTVVSDSVKGCGGPADKPKPHKPKPGKDKPKHHKKPRHHLTPAPIKSVGVPWVHTANCALVLPPGATYVMNGAQDTTYPGYYAEKAGYYKVFVHAPSGRQFHGGSTVVTRTVHVNCAASNSNNGHVTKPRPDVKPHQAAPAGGLGTVTMSTDDPTSIVLIGSGMAGAALLSLLTVVGIRRRRVDVRA